MIGDGGFVFALEKRGYVKAGPWTPEAAVEHPEAVRQLHREFLRAGSNVMQTFTFYASEDKLENRGNYVAEKISVSTTHPPRPLLVKGITDTPPPKFPQRKAGALFFFFFCAFSEVEKVFVA